MGGVGKHFTEQAVPRKWGEYDGVQTGGCKTLLEEGELRHPKQNRGVGYEGRRDEEEKRGWEHEGSKQRGGGDVVWMSVEGGSSALLSLPDVFLLPISITMTRRGTTVRWRRTARREGEATHAFLLNQKGLSCAKVRAAI